MPCNPIERKLRDVYAGGFKFAPPKLMTLNESEEYEGYITLLEDGITLIAIKHGQRRATPAEQRKLQTELDLFKQFNINIAASPIKIWCKISFFTAFDDNEEEKVIVNKQVVRTTEPFPERKDWQKEWVHRWIVYPIEGDNLPKPQPAIQACPRQIFALDPAKANTFNYINERRLLQIDLQQEVTLEILDNQGVPLRQGLLLSKQEEELGSIMLSQEVLPEEEECAIAAAKLELQTNIKGAGLTSAQSEKAKIIAISGWAR